MLLYNPQAPLQTKWVGVGVRVGRETGATATESALDSPFLPRTKTEYCLFRWQSERNLHLVTDDIVHDDDDDYRYR